MAPNRVGLLRLLAEHNVPEAAARMYIVASRSGPMTASELSRATAIHRVHGYRFLKDLVQRGLLRPVGTRPMRFAALPVEELVDRWIGDASRRLDGLRRDRDQILHEWKESGASPEEVGGRHFVVIEGRGPINRFIERRWGAARRSIEITARASSLGRIIDGGMDRTLRAATKRGVRSRMITEVTPSNLSEAKILASGVELRHSPRHVSSRTSVIDNAGVALFVTGEEGLGSSDDEQVLLWTTEPRFLTLTRQYHRRLWTRGIPMHERVAEVESPSRALLPVVRGHASEPFRRLASLTELGMTATGVREMQLDLTTFIEGVAGQVGRQVAQSIEGSTPDEIIAGLEGFYAQHATARMDEARSHPRTLRVRNCFACVQSPEVGRLFCPKMLQTVLETRSNGLWEVSKPDPTRHAKKGCLFSLRAA
ncbi:MAG: hypothetical protein L3K03_01680 [Thermoplasmata archaeon]|nr:hypothetical protein [Thermoplasmata archaeon]